VIVLNLTTPRGIEWHSSSGFRDEPHQGNSRMTLRDEYLSLWADHAPMPMFIAASTNQRSPKKDRHQSPAPPRTPLDCYTDFMRSFKQAFAEHLGSGGTVAEVLVGAGYGLVDIARHVTGRHFTQETRVQCALGDVEAWPILLAAS